MIKPGPYKLARDVKNPTPDRRQKYDWRALAVWKVGTEFVVREQRDMQLMDEEFIAGLSPEARAVIDAARTYTVIELVGDRWPTSHRVGPGNDEQYTALAEALVPSDESHEQFLARIDCKSNFGGWLVESGQVTREQFEKMWAAYQGIES